MKSIEFESAQNVKVEYELASVTQRTAAAFIDISAFVLYVIIFNLVVGLPDFFSTNVGMSDFVRLLLIKIPFIFYNPVIEYLTQGQSLGKYILGIRVMTVDGERPGLREVFTRWLFKGDFLWISANPLYVLFWLVIGILGIIYAGTSERSQRMGDVMANTVVIKNRSSVRYTLRDVLSIKSQSNYKPIYPGAIRFTDEDMLLIKNTIQRLQTNPNPATKKFAIELADESARLLGLSQTPKKQLEFLQTLLQDYVVLTR